MATIWLCLIRSKTEKNVCDLSITYKICSKEWDVKQTCINLLDNLLSANTNASARRCHMCAIRFRLNLVNDMASWTKIDFFFFLRWYQQIRITLMTWYNSANGSTAFKWKLYYHWWKGMWMHHGVLFAQCPACKSNLLPTAMSTGQLTDHTGGLGPATLATTYEDFGARSRYLRQGKVITSHSLLWDVITYTCLRYLLLAPKSPYSVTTFSDAQLEYTCKFSKQPNTRSTEVASVM